MGVLGPVCKGNEANGSEKDERRISPSLFAKACRDSFAQTMDMLIQVCSYCTQSVACACVFSYMHVCICSGMLKSSNMYHTNFSP